MKHKTDAKKQAQLIIDEHKKNGLSDEDTKRCAITTVNSEKKFTKLDMFNFAEHCMVKLLSKYDENGMGEISSYDLIRIREVLRNFTKTE